MLGLASLSKQYLLLMSDFITKRMNFVANGFAHIPFHVAVSNIILMKICMARDPGTFSSLLLWNVDFSCHTCFSIRNCIATVRHVYRPRLKMLLGMKFPPRVKKQMGKL